MNMSCICNPLECTNWRHSSGSLVYTLVKELKNLAFRSFYFYCFWFWSLAEKKKRKISTVEPVLYILLIRSTFTIHLVQYIVHNLMLDMQSTSAFYVLRIKISFRFALDSSVFNLKENHLRNFFNKFVIIVLKITWKTRLPTLQ